ncbi:MAG: tetratricopeptide repeat protein [Polyangiaceae bacterium]
MRSRVALLVTVSVGLVAAAAFAQTPGTPMNFPASSPSSAAATAPKPATPATSAKPVAAPAPAATTGANGKPIRRDPEGRTGISPYNESVVKGQAAFAARDFAGAVTAFQEAIKLDPTAMLGYYLAGEAQLENGKPDEADAMWTSALTKKGSEDLQSRVMFVLADLKERQKSWTAAKDAWSAYQVFVTGHAAVKGYVATAEERIKRIDQRIKDEKDYGAVKERIKAREAERLKEAEENAKKDKLNK